MARQHRATYSRVPVPLRPANTDRRSDSSTSSPATTTPPLLSDYIKTPSTFLGTYLPARAIALPTCPATPFTTHAPLTHPHSHPHSPTRFYAPAPILTHTSSHRTSSHHSHSYPRHRSSTYIIPTPSQGYTAPGPSYTYPPAQASNPSYVIMPPRSKTFQALVSVLPHHLLQPPLPPSVRSPLSSHFSFLLLS